MEDSVRRLIPRALPTLWTSSSKWGRTCRPRFSRFSYGSDCSTQQLAEKLRKRSYSWSLIEKIGTWPGSFCTEGEGHYGTTDWVITNRFTWLPFGLTWVHSCSLRHSANKPRVPRRRSPLLPPNR
jgi:hypothetical protein